MGAPARWIHTARGVPAPWFRARPLLALGTAAVLYGGVFVLRLLMDDPMDAISMLYVFPVALVGMSRGRLAGLTGGLLAVALVGVWALVDSVDLSAVGWLARALPLLLVGALVGDASDRLEHAAEEREAHHLALQRQREAVEINDTLVQRMSAAKWSIEAGRTEAGLRVLGDTVELGHQLVSQLIRETGAGLSTVAAHGTKVPPDGDAGP